MTKRKTTSTGSRPSPKAKRPARSAASQRAGSKSARATASRAKSRP